MSRASRVMHNRCDDCLRITSEVRALKKRVSDGLAPIQLVWMEPMIAS